MNALTTENSTIVRAMPIAATLGRAYFALVSRVLPGVASDQVERMFTTPPRYAGRVTPSVNARRRFVRSGARALAVWEAGSANDPTVLLAHGWGGRGVQMEAFVAPLLQRGFRVAWFDQPGHGDSGEGPVGLPDFVHALEAIGKTLGHLHAVVGHSLGAAALGIALRRGLPIARAVFIGSPASMSEQAGAFARMIGIAPWVRDVMRLRLERRYGMPFEEIDDVEELQHVMIPALFVHDAGDREVPFENALRLSSRMPNARLLRTYGLGHRRALREHGVIAAIAEFADGVDDMPGEWPRLPRPAPLY